MHFKIQNVLFSAIFALMFTLVACQKTSLLDATSSTLDAATYDAIATAQDRGGIGSAGCYDLVFPLSIQLPDSSVVEVTSYDDLKTTVRTWFEANGPKSHGRRFSFVYPFSVISVTGEVIEVTGVEQLGALRDSCLAQGGGLIGGGHHGDSTATGCGHHGDSTLTGGGHHGDSTATGGHNGGHQGGGHNGGSNPGGGHSQVRCFDFVFPVTIAFPDGTTAIANSSQELKDLQKNWKKNNPTATGRPEIAYPVTVKMTADSTLVTVASETELKALRDGCK